MLILLDCRPLQHTGAGNERSRLILSCVQWLSSCQGVKWLFVAEKGWQEEGTLPVTVPGEWVTLKALPGVAGWKLWYDWQIPRAADKYKVDMVMTTDGRAAGSMTIPQCCWMPYGRGLKKKGLPKGLDKAGAIFCFSEEDKKGMRNARIVHPAADTQAMQLLGEEKQNARALFADGKEYFYAEITGVQFSEVIVLLKAFSMFKKRQHSNMKLVFAGTGDGPDKKFAESLESYKFREDVSWLVHPSTEERWRIPGGAYAMIYCPRHESIGLGVLNAWKAGVPVVSMAATGIQGAGEAFLQVEKAGDAAQLAEYLKLLYKDEGLRGRLIEKGLLQTTYFSPERLGGEVWEGISAIKS